MEGLTQFVSQYDSEKTAREAEKANTQDHTETCAPQGSESTSSSSSLEVPDSATEPKEQGKDVFRQTKRYLLKQPFLSLL